MKAALLWVLTSSLALAWAAAEASADAEPVQATQAYREAYGPPPVSDAQGGLAAGTYHPGVGASGRADRLSPLPLFSVTPDKVTEEAARILVEGHPTSARFFNVPRVFPEGSKLLGLESADGVATVRVRQGRQGERNSLAPQALAHTLTQFDGVHAVALQVDGEGLSDPVKPRPDILDTPAPPRLLDVVAAVHEGEDPEQIAVLFDRPVEVALCSIRLADGKDLPGNLYTSMFDMAAILRPEDPKVIREGLPMLVKWSVRDKTGRLSKGEISTELRIYQRPD